MNTPANIARSRNIPVEELEQRLDELDGNRERLIILVCRSANAAEILNQAEFSRVGVLRGGMLQWNSADLPVER